MASIFDYPNEPRYNIKAVSQRTDIQPVTIRAWERRYNLLSPNRAANGYRHYSERDIAILDWVKSQLNLGVSISSIALDFHQMTSQGKWPDAILSSGGFVAVHPTHQIPKETAIKQLTMALIRHDERMSVSIFEEILGSFKLTDLFEAVLIPILADIGEKWANGEINVATEHFASNFIQGSLHALFQSLPLRPSGPRLIVGCAPDELHVIGPLMLSILLRDAGYRVEFLGPDIPLDDLIDYAEEEKPKMLILSATLANTASSLATFPEKLRKLKQPPLFGYGGAAFNHDGGLIGKSDGIFLGPCLKCSVETITNHVELKTLQKK